MEVCRRSWQCRGSDWQEDLTALRTIMLHEGHSSALRLYYNTKGHLQEFVPWVSSKSVSLWCAEKLVQRKKVFLVQSPNDFACGTETSWGHVAAELTWKSPPPTHTPPTNPMWHEKSGRIMKRVRRHNKHLDSLYGLNISSWTALS